MPRMRVLIIEDDVELCKDWATVLMPYFQVEYATDMKAGCNRLDDTTQPKIDCIYLDMILPNGRGLNLIDKFQSRYPTIPLIVITGMDVEAEKVILAGAHAFFQKGQFSLDQLRDCTIQTVARHKVRGRYAPIQSDMKEARKELSGLSELITKSEPP